MTNEQLQEEIEELKKDIKYLREFVDEDNFDAMAGSVPMFEEGDVAGENPYYPLDEDKVRFSRIARIWEGMII